MAFKDVFPFKDESPAERREHEVAPTPQARWTSTPRVDAPTTGLEGHTGLYRLAFKAMPVPGFPDELKIGNATISQVQGPIWTQRTHVAQRPGWRPVFDKTMEQGLVEVGDGFVLTVIQLAVTIDADVSRGMNVWRDQALAAASIVVALLDERVAQELLAEDLVVLDEDGLQGVAVLDQVARLRRFPGNRMLEAHRQALRQLESVDLEHESPVLAAARWYLRGAQLGPTPDAVVFFWIALEALAKPPYGTKLTKAEKARTDVAWVEQAISAAGLDLATVDPSVGRLAGLRAEVVHGGVEEPELLDVGYYALEQLVRLLIRHRLEIRVGWPLSPGASNVRRPLSLIVGVLGRFPKTNLT